MSALNYTDKSDVINVVYNAAIAKMLSKNFTDEERNKLGHSMDDILYDCTFNNQPCSSKDFIWKFDRFYGNCFVFNSGFNQSGQRVDLKQSLLGGSSYGLSLAFYIGFHENLTLFNSVFGAGGFVKVSNQFIFTT
jgi:hypothetical protein